MTVYNKKKSIRKSFFIALGILSVMVSYVLNASNPSETIEAERDGKGASPQVISYKKSELLAIASAMQKNGDFEELDTDRQQGMPAEIRSDYPILSRNRVSFVDSTLVITPPSKKREE